MAAKEYRCRLRRLKTPVFTATRWEDVGELLTIPVNFSSVPSKIDALLYAIDQYNGRESIDKYRLRVHDDDGHVCATIVVTPEELEWHEDGYLTNAADGTAPHSLSGFTDEELVAELRRRLAERWADPSSVSRNRWGLPRRTSRSCQDSRQKLTTVPGSDLGQFQGG